MLSLHEDNFAPYWVSPSEFSAWKKDGPHNNSTKKNASNCLWHSFIVKFL